MIIDEIINTMCNVYGVPCPDEEEEEGQDRDEFDDSGMEEDY